MKKMQRPDDYASREEWNEYYKLHPNMRRSVGAEGVEDAGGDGSAAPEGGDAPAGESSEAGEAAAAPTGEAEASETTDEGKAKETPDSNSQDGEADGGKGGDEDGADAVTYTADDFTMPEGMEVDEAMMSEFLDIANNEELSGKDRDQALVDLYAKKMQQAAEQQQEAWDNVRKDWQDQVKEDKDLGGKNLDKTKATSVQVLSEYGSPELMEFLENYGMLDHPDMLRFLVKVGATTSEDQAAHGRDGAQAPVEDRWYKDSE